MTTPLFPYPFQLQDLCSEDFAEDSLDRKMASLEYILGWIGDSSSFVLLPPLVAFMAIFWLTRGNSILPIDLSPSMSPDTVSSLFPDRPIRPLPKRRLRERLSPEVADSITYPPSTHETTPLFYYPPYTLKEEAHSAALGLTSPDEHGRRYESGRELPPSRSGLRPGEREAEETNLRSTLVTRSPPEILTRDPGQYSRADQSRHSEPPPSATSSVDGYDSFENTNNKKKRKVPTAGDSALGGAHTLNSEMRALTMSSGTDSTLVEQNGDQAHSVPGNAGNGPFMANTTGISGPGRGRIGGSRNGRSPLRALTDGSNTLAGRSSKSGTAQWAQPGMLSSLRFLLYFLSFPESILPFG